MQFISKTLLPSILVTGLSVIVISAVNPDATTAATVDITTTRNPRQGRIYRMRQRSRDYRLLTIRQNILRHLQWSSPPTTMDPEVRRQLMLNITREYSDEDWAGNQMVQYDEEEYMSSFNFPSQHSRPLWRRPPHGTLNMYFDLVESSYPDNQVEVRNGTLKIMMKSRNECSCGDDRDYDLILLYLHRYKDYLRRNRNNNRNRPNRRRGRGNADTNDNTELIAVEMFRMHPENSVRIEFNVTETVAMWVSDPSTNKGLKIEAKDSRGRLLDVRKIFEHAPFTSRPLSHYRRFRYRDVAPRLLITKVITPGFNML